MQAIEQLHNENAKLKKLNQENEAKIAILTQNMREMQKLLMEHGVSYDCDAIGNGSNNSNRNTSRNNANGNDPPAAGAHPPPPQLVFNTPQTTANTAAAGAGAGADRAHIDVDEQCPFRNVCHVYSNYIDNHGVYDAMLSQCNIADNNNKFFHLQVLQKDDESGFYAFFRWGRVGSPGKHSVLEGDEQTCVNAFEKKFYAKTGNHWNERDSFVVNTRKYSFIRF